MYVKNEEGISYSSVIFFKHCLSSRSFHFNYVIRLVQLLYAKCAYYRYLESRAGAPEFHAHTFFYCLDTYLVCGKQHIYVPQTTLTPLTNKQS